MKRKLIITGSRGFIGRTLVPMFQNGYDVFTCDIQDGSDVFKIVDLMDADVLHLAALTNVQESFDKEDEYYYTNVLGTAHLARLCIEQGKTFYYASSAAIAEPESSPYAHSKAMAQDIIDHLHPKLRAVGFVPFNIYSDNPKKGTLFYNFLHDEELRINGLGSQTRDFIHITDVCNIIKTAIDEQWKPCNIEIGTGRLTSVNSIAEIFQRHMEKKIVHMPVVQEVEDSVADVKFLKQMYKKKLVTSLEADIERMVKKFN